MGDGFEFFLNSKIYLQPRQMSNWAKLDKEQFKIKQNKITTSQKCTGLCGKREWTTGREWIGFGNELDIIILIY